MRLARLLPAILAAACGAAQRPPPAEPNMNEFSEPYVKLVLAVGQHDPAYVDAYYGPPEWPKEVEAAKPTLPAIRADAEALLGRLRAMTPPADDLLALRHRYFLRHLEALLARVDMLEGKKLSFDEESRALYNAVAPAVSIAKQDELLARLEKLVPGDGPLAARVEAMRSALVVPPEKIEAVFAAAIAECKARTMKHIELPPGESFQVELVKNKPWSAYNWYKGGFRSVIQINTDLPFHINRAVELACHEGYPGHHVYNGLLEQRLVRERGWTELTVYPLFSPMSLIAEGSANYGIEITFPGAERLEFERRVLYPLAGLDPARAEVAMEAVLALQELKYARVEAARGLIDATMDAPAAEAYLQRYLLMEPERAKQFVRFIEANRSYVVNYALGEDLARSWVAKQGGDPWKAFERILSTPMLASDLER